MPSGPFLIPIIVATYYAVVWAIRGRDPKPGSVVTRYEPPQGIRPAVARFAMQGFSDGKMLAAVLVSMAVKKAIRITPEGDEWIVASVPPGASAAPATDALRRTANQYPQLAPEESRVFDLMFQWGDPARFRGFDQQHASVLVNDIEASMRERYDKQFFDRNTGWSVAAVFASFLALMYMATDFPSGRAIFLTFWLFWFSYIFMAVTVVRLSQALKDVVHGRATWQMASATAMWTALACTLPVLVGWKMVADSSSQFVLTLLLSAAVHATAIPLLKHRSCECQQLLDDLAGYRLFLAGVDAAQLQQLNTPGKAAELMNESLAYAIALDVSERWGDRFAGAFAAATVAIG